jgi:ketosteroid isomerase-like protein
MSQENVEVVRRTMEIGEAGARTGDPGAAFDQCVAQGLITSNLEWRAGRRAGIGVAGLGDVAGREGYVESIRTLTEDFEEMAWEYEQIVDAGHNRVVMIIRWQGTGKGSGVHVEMRTGMVFTLEAGRIVRVTLFMNPDEALKAAGLRE